MLVEARAARSVWAYLCSYCGAKGPATGGRFWSCDRCNAVVWRGDEPTPRAGAQRDCWCGGNPGDYEGPLRDCPVHGERAGAQREEESA